MKHLLIEALHLIQDEYHFISAKHVVALASEMKLSHTEVYEVATFYHHFDVIKEDQTPPPPLTIRVCESVTCEMYGAKKLTESLKQLFTDGSVTSEQIRIQAVPCVGRCQHAPVAVIGKNPIDSKRGNTVSITNLPLTLREVMVNYGFRPSGYNTTTINLTRDTHKFRMTVGQLFNRQSPDIFIQDKDRIEIDDTLSIPPKDSRYDKKVIDAVRVGSQGNILLPGVGSIKAINRTLTDLHEEVYKKLRKKGLVPKFQLELTKFESNKAYLISEGSNNKVIKITDSGIHIKELILGNGFSVNSDTSLSVVTLTRRGQVFRMTTEEIFAPNAPNLWIKNQDQIEVTNLDYKLGQVFALGGAGNAKIVTIDPSKRETLADILFVTGGALSNVLAKRSEVYLLRGRSPSIAYHLDAQNVSRILVAAQTELRPNDIVYVADRPIISFSRTLAELNPLRILLRDLEDGNIP